MAAHELKTPLALMRVQIELEPDDRRSPELLKDVDHMARQVQQLLHLAEVCEHQRYRMEDIAPADIIGEVCDFMARASENAACTSTARSRTARLPGVPTGARCSCCSRT